MRLTEIVYMDAKPIDGYAPGAFRIGGALYEGALAVLPSGIAPWNGLEDPAPFLAAADDIDVLFVGTGAEIAPLPEAFRAPLDEVGVGLEPMASPTACRTYNVLLSEGRRIGLALLPL